MAGVLSDDTAFWIMTLKLFKTPVNLFLATVIHTWKKAEGQEIACIPWELTKAGEGRIRLWYLSFDA